MNTMMSTKSSPPKSPIVLGLDPGLGRFGWAILTGAGQPRLVAAGCMTTPANSPTPDRLKKIYIDLAAILQEFTPDRVAAEELFFTNNVTTAMQVGQARGVAFLAIAQAGLPIIEYSPTTIKSSVAGYGRADKAQMTTMVMTLLKLDQRPRYDDTIDALAVALCGMQALVLP